LRFEQYRHKHSGDPLEGRLSVYDDVDKVRLQGKRTISGSVLEYLEEGVSTMEGLKDKLSILISPRTVDRGIYSTVAQGYFQYKEKFYDQIITRVLQAYSGYISEIMCRKKEILSAVGILRDRKSYVDHMMNAHEVLPTEARNARTLLSEFTQDHLSEYTQGLAKSIR